MELPNILNLEFVPPERFASGIQAFDELFRCRLGDSVGLARGSINVVTGKPGLGKSTLVMQILDGLTRAGCFTVFASNEQTKNYLVGLAKGIHLQHGVNIVLDDRFTTEELLATVKALAVEHSARQLVLVLDSLQGMNLSEKNSTARAWEDLETFARETGAIVLLINHLRKDQRVIAGAAKILQRCDSIMELKRDDGDGRILYVDKNRHGRSGVSIAGLSMTDEHGIDFSAAHLGDTGGEGGGEARSPRIRKQRTESSIKLLLGALNAERFTTLDEAEAACPEEHRRELRERWNDTIRYLRDIGAIEDNGLPTFQKGYRLAKPRAVTMK